MALVTTAQLIAAARACGTGVLAFNVITIEHAQAIAAAAGRTGRPAILQISQNAARYHGGLSAIAAATRDIAQRCPARLSLHLDHVDDLDLLRQAPAAGFSSVMVDASRLPYAANVTTTRDATAWAHGHGLWVEAELGYVGGKPDAPANAHAAGVRTDPQEAARYVAETDVDALAVAVGSSHAMAERTAALDLDLLAAIRDAVPVPLVLHGSSGVPLEQIRAATGRGMTKINVGTALNVAFTDAVRVALPATADPRRYLAAGREAMTGVVSRLLELLEAP
ncbi:class II fructose-bisphosphate aldolase [Actinoplanes sp. DH11]|uniref:class II fructose-bisphosphate aldolase n=1 Tax=Actinoplanes sp. DH11 TaxID=2857011 RepID=UPI001E605258|nr:class II fructose-bisphosphate aldolase [Actinoplanes sp. DH11]